MTKKHYLMLCELHHPYLHGEMTQSGHYLIFGKFNPHTNACMEIEGESEATGTSEAETTEGEEEQEEVEATNLNEEIGWLQNAVRHYLRVLHKHPHPTISNYSSIVSRSNYVKAEIGEYVLLPDTLEAVAILKTFWIRIIQRAWKRICRERRQFYSMSRLSQREITVSSSRPAGLVGMLVY